MKKMTIFNWKPDLKSMSIWWDSAMGLLVLLVAALLLLA